MPQPRVKDLTPEQAETAARLRASGIGDKPRDWRAVSKEMGVSEYALVKHFDPHRYEQRIARQRESAARMCRERKSGHSIVPPGKPMHIPEHVLNERERRAAILPASLTAALMGDPIPGCSALDHRKVAGTFRQIGDVAAELVRRLA